MTISLHNIRYEESPLANELWPGQAGGDEPADPPARESEPQPGECPECRGTGVVDGAECPLCDGHGSIEDRPLWWI